MKKRPWKWILSKYKEVRFIPSIFIHKQNESVLLLLNAKDLIPNNRTKVSYISEIELLVLRNNKRPLFCFRDKSTKKYRSLLVFPWRLYYWHNWMMRWTITENEWVYARQERIMNIFFKLYMVGPLEMILINGRASISGKKISRTTLGRIVNWALWQSGDTVIGHVCRIKVCFDLLKKNKTEENKNTEL